MDRLNGLGRAGAGGKAKEGVRDSGAGEPVLVGVASSQGAQVLARDAIELV